MSTAPAEVDRRVDALVRDAQRAVVGAEGREALETAVCETLAAGEPYAFAWIGSVDRTDGEAVDVRTAAGIDPDAVDDIVVWDGGRFDADGGPAAAAITGSPTVTTNGSEPAGEEPWRAARLDTPFEARLAVPLAAERDQHGVLVVYSERAGAFDDREVDCLESLAETVALGLADLAERAELESRKQKYERLTERISDAYFAVDSDWAVTYWNEQISRRTGLDAAEVIGQTLWAVAPQIADTEVEGYYREAMATQEPRSFEYNFEEPEDYWVAVDVYPDEDGISVFSRDITERKEYERRLKHQRDDLEILNQVVRHDIRNDLQLISAYAELLTDRVEEPDLEYVETISRRARTAVALTQSARSLAAVMLQDENETEPIPLRSTLETQIEETRATYPEAVIRQSGEIPSVAVCGNELLSSVFRNLLKNAVQHNDNEVPEVAVSVTVSGADVAECEGQLTAGEDEETDDREAVTVRIADNGRGISDERKGQIFGKGEKGLESGGTGVGLYLVGSLVESYGGTVAVEDNDPEGAVFAVTLPVVD